MVRRSPRELPALQGRVQEEGQACPRCTSLWVLKVPFRFSGGGGGGGGVPTVVTFQAYFS